MTYLIEPWKRNGGDETKGQDEGRFPFLPQSQSSHGC